MGAYLAGLSGLEKVFLSCAVFGGGIFIMRMILMLFGADQGDADMDVDVDMDVDADTDMDVDDGATGADDSGFDEGDVDASLKLLTVQGLTAFIMMFGLTGFSVSRSSAVGSVVTVGVGCGVGVFAMWLVAKGFAVMKSLQSSGTMNLYDTMGEEGTVYLTIPSEGIGKVRIIVSGRLKVRDAVSQDKVEIKTGERVSVSEITNQRMLVVRKV